MRLPVPKRLKQWYAAMMLSPVAKRVKRLGLTYLSPERLCNIERCIASIRREQVPGICIEAGVALGGSGILISSAMAPESSFRGYDVFGMIPAPTENDDEKSHARYTKIAGGRAKGIRGQEYYGYETDLLSKVTSSFALFGHPVDGKRVSLYRGLFEDTLQFETGIQVAFAHIDCDWYDPVNLCLERIYPVWSPGGYFVIDDYNDYGGCRRAVNEFLEQHSDVLKVSDSSNLVLRRELGIR